MKEDKNKSSFELLQEGRIRKRLQRYNNVETVREQLEELGDLSPYQRYKIDKVSGYLIQAIQRIEAGAYGNCIVCSKPIAKKRLEIVPAALACVTCDDKRET